MKKEYLTDLELQNALWCLVSCLDNSKYEPVITPTMTELEWVKDGICHALDFFERRYNLTTEEIDVLADMAYEADE